MKLKKNTIKKTILNLNFPTSFARFNIKIKFLKIYQQQTIN